MYPIQQAQGTWARRRGTHSSASAAREKDNGPKRISAAKANGRIEGFRSSPSRTDGRQRRPSEISKGRPLGRALSISYHRGARYGGSHSETAMSCSAWD